MIRKTIDKVLNSVEGTGQTTEQAETGVTAAIKKYLAQSQTATIFVIFVVIFIISSILSENFLTPYNLSTMAFNLSFVGIVTLAQGSLLLQGDIDISLGSIAGLAAVITATLMMQTGINPIVTIFIGIAFGALFGTINGSLVTYFNLNPIVLTIGAMYAYDGFNLVYTEGRNITGFPLYITRLGGGQLFGVPIPLFFFLGVFVIYYFLTKKTVYGRKIYALGDNREAARIVGIKVDKLRIIGYSLAGAFSGLAGILMAFRMAAAQSTIGDPWLLPSIAGPIIGGIAIKGGIGSITGALIGAALMVVVGNIIVLAGVAAYWQQAVNGSIIIFAVVMDSVAKKYR